LIVLFAKAGERPTYSAEAYHKKARTRGEGVFVRAGYSSRLATTRKRRSRALPEDSSTADPARSARPLTPADRAARVAVLQKSLNGKASTFHARVCEQGGPQP
jgi:hypothetical protein